MYKVWTETDIRKVLNDIGIKMGMSCESVPIIISKKMTRCKGMFTFSYKNINGVNTIVPVNFKFSSGLINGNYSEEVVRNTILHEYSHFYTNCKYNKSHGHNTFFKRTCRKIGISDDTYFTGQPLVKVACRDENITEIKCSCCGKVVATRKRKDAVYNLLVSKISKML